MQHSSDAPSRRLPRSGALLLLSFCIASSLSGCSKTSPPEEPAPPPPDTAAAPTPEDTRPTPAPRPRSEPPPRPPLPDGIARFDKDAITLTLSGDGRFLAGGDLAGKSLLWDLPSGRFLWGDPTPVGNRIGRVVFAETGDIWVGGSFDEPDRPWRAWAAATLERRGEFGTPGEVAIDLALDTKGETAVVLTSAADGSLQHVSVWKLDAQVAHFTAQVPRSARGAVAISPDGRDVAASDDRGGLVRFDLAPIGGEGLDNRRIELITPSSDAVPARVARLAYLGAESADRAGLWAAIGPTIRRFPMQGDDPTAQSPVVELADNSHPIRGLHRVQRTGEAAATLVVATRPEAGGLAFWDLTGQFIGELVSGCRCESHALSFDGTMAACGCAPASELRYGAPRWGAARMPQPRGD